MLAPIPFRFSDAVNLPVARPVEGVAHPVARPVEGVARPVDRMARPSAVGETLEWALCDRTDRQIALTR